jgi:hypothetical protein
VTKPDRNFRHLAGIHPSAAGAEFLRIPAERFAVAGDRYSGVEPVLRPFALLD